MLLGPSGASHHYNPVPGFLYFTAVAAAFEKTWAAAGSLWAGLGVLAVSVTLPAFPGARAGWTSWRYRGRYVDHATLNPDGRILLARVQAAGAVAAGCYAVQAGAVEDPRPGLPWHEWEIAATLRDLTDDEAAPATGGGDTGQPHQPGPEAAAALQAVTARVAALEDYAAALEQASTALRDRDTALAHSAGPGSLQLTLAATADRHAHRTTELTTVTAVTQTLAEALGEQP
jgi:hypothetical protein